mgnify:CR=1 FL=1
MKLSITGRHTDVTPRLKQYIRKRLGKWKTFLGPAAEVRVTLTAEGYRRTAEVSIVEGRNRFNGRQTTKEMFSSIDLLSEKVGRQLLRRHEILAAQRGPGAAAVTRPSVREGKREQERGHITEITRVAGKPMTREEAALQLGTLRKAFLVFEDADTGRLAVLTKRRDGNYQLIVND